ASSRPPDADSNKAPRDRALSPRRAPSVYSPPTALDAHAVCIPAPYADSSQEYTPAPISFYGPSVLSYPPPNHGWMEPKPHFSNRFCSTNLFSFATKVFYSHKNSELNSCSTPLRSDMHFCAVCHDYASGYHYGVWSCEGCKAFFKRSIQGHNDYICPATNQCTIDKNRRKSCQACRLRKCYEVGMMKCGVRRERCSYRGTRHRRGSLSGGRGLVRMGLNCRSQRQLHLESPLNPVSQRLVGAHSSGPLAFNPEEFISRIIEAEPPQIYLMEEMKKPLTESSIMMTLTNLADKELVLMISWAKKIPGFVELSLSDQIHLLKCCWLEILMLGLMWRSVDHPGKLIFSPDFNLNRDEGHCVEGIMEIFDMLLAATSRFRELKLQREEYVCLKAMVLLNSNLCNSTPQTAEEMESRSKLLRLLDAVIDSLVWAISKLGLSSQQQTLRLGHLTMLLSHIRHSGAKLSIYRSIYVPTLTYGHEIWVMTERTRSWIQAAEMSFLRRVVGRTLRDRVRSSVTREELGVESLLLHVERSQLRWLGHLFRMPPGCLLVAFLGRCSRHVLLGGGLVEGPGHAGGTTVCLRAGLVSPRSPPRTAGGGVRGSGSLGISAETAASTTRPRIKRKKMDGWKIHMCN
uniref:Estrogen receptor beta n=1 Tax=Neogobius melanostomus TaxID=47308 RepID=A0A8C6SA52_9GOBI